MPRNVLTFDAMKRRLHASVVAVLVSATAVWTVAHGQTTVHGNAANLGGGCYRLTQNQATQRGAVWMNGLVDISQDWEMRAEVYLGTSNGGADGMVFVLRSPSAPVLGGGGSLMGFGGNITNPAIEPSVGVEMDTYWQTGGPATGDPSYDHLGIQRDGSVAHVGADVIAFPVIAETPNGNLEDGQEYSLRVTYEADIQQMKVYWDCNERISTTVDLESILGTNMVKWGFTASTGGLYNLHRVCDAEWIETEEIVLDDVLTCSGVPVNLSLSDQALDVSWSPSTGLSSSVGNEVTATLESTETYTFTYEDICGESYSETVTVEVVEIPPSGLPSDTTSCDAPFIELLNGPWPAGISGVWEDGSTDAVRTLSGEGVFALTVTDDASGCSYTDAVNLVAIDLPLLELGPGATVCEGEAVGFDVGTVDPVINLLWNGNAGPAAVDLYDDGPVILEWGAYGCLDSDTSLIIHHPTYSVDWEENPIVLCLDEVVTVEAVDPDWSSGAVDWSWNDGSNDPSLTISTPGNYVVEINTDECTFFYDVDAVASANTGVNLGPDVLLCDNESVTFLSGYMASQTLWVSGGNAAGMNTLGTTVNGSSATVIAVVTVGQCVESDTAVVAHVPFFDAGLPSSLDLCLNDSLFIEANPGADAYTWNNGPAMPGQWVDEAGSYVVQSTIDGCSFADQVNVVPSANTGVNLGADVVLCDGNTFTASSGYSAAETAWWQNGFSQGNGATFSVNGMDATIVAQVTIGSCVERDTIWVDYAPVFNTGLGSSVPLCNGDSTLVASNPGAPSYQWSTGETTSAIWIDAPGLYTLTTPIQGCNYSVNINIQNIPLPVFDLGPDETICEGQSITLNTGLVNADATLWSNGSSGPTLDVSNAGTYSVVVTENGCFSEDEIVISVQELPEFDLGPDWQLCPSESAYLYIYPFPENATASWNTGSSLSAIYANTPGVYSALVNWNGCLWTDEVVVEKAAPLFIDIVEPLKFCEGESLVVSAENPTNLFPIAYQWSNGETTPAIQIDWQGIYEATLSNACESISKSFEVTVEYCECPIYAANAFTPDNDGVNDIFRPVLGCEPLTYRLEIFNVWGHMVFATEDPDTGWFGQIEGQPETNAYSGYYGQNGVYHWRIKASFEEEGLFYTPEITRQGHVHMVH